MSKYDILMEAYESINNINLKIEYCTDLFDHEFINKFIDNYLRIVNMISNNPDIKIKDINLINEESQNLMQENISEITENMDIDFNF